jgi:hypothetical protein
MATPEGDGSRGDANWWRGFPFFGVSYLAGMQANPGSSTRRPGRWRQPLAPLRSTSSRYPPKHVIIVTTLLTFISRSTTSTSSRDDPRRPRHRHPGLATYSYEVAFNAPGGAGV